MTGSPGWLQMHIGCDGKGFLKVYPPVDGGQSEWSLQRWHNLSPCMTKARNLSDIIRKSASSWRDWHKRMWPDQDPPLVKGSRNSTCKTRWGVGPPGRDGSFAADTSLFFAMVTQSLGSRHAPYEERCGNAERLIAILSKCCGDTAFNLNVPVEDRQGTLVNTVSCHVKSGYIDLTDWLDALPEDMLRKRYQQEFQTTVGDASIKWAAGDHANNQIGIIVSIMLLNRHGAQRAEPPFHGAACAIMNQMACIMERRLPSLLVPDGQMKAKDMLVRNGSGNLLRYDACAAMKIAEEVSTSKACRRPCQLTLGSQEPQKVSKHRLEPRRMPP